MTTLQVKRVNAVPNSPYDPSTIYIVKAANTQLVELYFTNEGGSTLRRVLTEGDVAALLSAASVASAAKLTTARTINGVSFDGTANITINAVDSTARIAVSEKGIPNGVATLDGNSQVPLAQINTRFDNIVEAANLASFPVSGSTLKVYVALNTNLLYRWDAGTTAYVAIGGGTLPDIITAGEYPVATVNSKGLVTSGRNLVASDIPNIPGSKINSAISVDTSGNAATATNATKLATARTINGVAFDGTANITINAVDSTARIASSEKGVANGVATLDATGKVPASQLPSYVDYVKEYANFAALPGTGETDKIYVTLDDNRTYRWGGSAYVRVGADAATADTALKLTNARTIGLSGDGTWSVSFDGSANASAALVLANVNASPQADTFRRWTVNAKGLVTASSAVGSADITGALGYSPVDRAGDTMTGDLTVNKASAAVKLNTTAGTFGAVSYSTAGNLRWVVGKDATAEGGSNAGSDYRINRYNDAGALQDTPVFINRASGFVGIGLGSATERLTVGDPANGVDVTVGVRAKTAGGASTRALITQGSATGSFKIKVDADGNGSEGAFILENSTGEILRTLATRQVVIGTAAATDGAKVTVNGTVSVATATASTHAPNLAQVRAMMDEILHPFLFMGVTNAQ